MSCEEVKCPPQVLAWNPYSPAGDTLGAKELLGGWGPRNGYRSLGDRKSVLEVDSLVSPGFWFCFPYCPVRHGGHHLSHTLHSVFPVVMAGAKMKPSASNLFSSELQITPMGCNYQRTDPLASVGDTKGSSAFSPTSRSQLQLHEVTSVHADIVIIPVNEETEKSPLPMGIQPSDVSGLPTICSLYSWVFPMLRPLG